MTNTERIQANNVALQECVELAESLPEGGSGMVVCNVEKPTKDTTISKLEDLKISFPNVKSIDANAFCDGTVGQQGSFSLSIKEVDLPVATSIGHYAFYQCKKLAKVNAPNVTDCGADCFYGCESLKEVYMPRLTTLSGEVFCNTGLEYIDLSNVTHIYSFALSYTKLKNIDAPLVTYLGDNSAYGCTALQSVNLPLITDLPSGTFCECTSLINIDLPNVTNIGSVAFSGCTSLTNVNLSKVENINGYAFSNCTSLTSVNLPNATSIDYNTFSKCASLTSVNLPQATSIGEYAFYKCTNLQAVILRTTETVCTIALGAFIIDDDEDGNPMVINDKFYIPSSMYEIYRAVYEPVFEEYGFGGYFDIVFHKIEDYPEICGG